MYKTLKRTFFIYGLGQGSGIQESTIPLKSSGFRPFDKLMVLSLSKDLRRNDSANTFRLEFIQHLMRDLNDKIV